MNKSLRIAQICPYDLSRPGGVKSHIFSLTDQLRALGHQVSIIAPKGPKMTGVNYFGNNESLKIFGTQIDINIAVRNEYHSLKEFIRSSDFDVIHYHTIWNPAIPFQIRFLSGSLNTKHVATFHDTPKSKFIGKMIMPIGASIISTFLDTIISVSKSQAKYINPLIRKDIPIIPNGIDIPADSGQAFNITVHPKKILFLGRLEPRKGVIHALNAYAAAKSKYPDIELVIAGDGEEMSKAKEFVDKNQIKNVKFHGFVSEEEKGKLLRESDIYIAPALYGESFGIVLLEAMISGTPIIGYLNEGYQNVINERQTDYFASAGDTQQLSNALLKLLQSSQEERMELAKSGYQQAKEFDWKLIASQINDQYEKLID